MQGAEVSREEIYLLESLYRRSIFLYQLLKKVHPFELLQLGNFQNFDLKSVFLKDLFFY